MFYLLMQQLQIEFFPVFGVKLGPRQIGGEELLS